VTQHRDEDFAGYIPARLPSLRRLAFLLCHDWHRADDLAQSAVIKVYLHWQKAASADNTDRYVNTILVREFLRDRGSSWARRVSPIGSPPEMAATPLDQKGLLDLKNAVAALPPRQRAALVLRFYCDLSAGDSAQILGCTPGTVKSQTSKALQALRRTLGTAADLAATGIPGCNTAGAAKAGGTYS
jgi:RNA polymerase sigma-70 factor (sigma-E family)